ncbi:hypothetical protein [uncultured Pontibacter sp.]|uniref:hypothetical protein n=1 Tax=uncultured Pontibacter sp. TaxID=453356 RepID=UPI002608FCE9|nr:hypothetical protein [uncultured Pontibacter sp.]
MKTTIVNSIILLLLSITACQQEASVQTIMQNEAQRKEVYNMILEDDEMNKEMMQVMREKNSGDMMGDAGMMGKGHMMMGDSAGMMGGMDQGQMRNMMQQMMAACAQDSANCSMMSGMMMGNSDMMRNMMQQMRQKGMIDDACMQQMVNSMSQMKK